MERRRILTELSKGEDPIAIPAVNSPFGGGAVDSEIVHDVLFYHLPKMAEHGYVTFDGPNGTVSRGPSFDLVRPYLASRNGHRDGEKRE